MLYFVIEKMSFWERRGLKQRTSQLSQQQRSKQSVVITAKKQAISCHNSKGASNQLEQQQRSKQSVLTTALKKTNLLKRTKESVTRKLFIDEGKTQGHLKT